MIPNLIIWQMSKKHTSIQPFSAGESEERKKVCHSFWSSLIQQNQNPVTLFIFYPTNILLYYVTAIPLNNIEIRGNFWKFISKWQHWQKTTNIEKFFDYDPQNLEIEKEQKFQICRKELWMLL